MKGKLVIGLMTAGLFLAGFGGAVLPASAEPHHFLLKLANGTSIPYTGEPGTAPSSITVAGVAIPVVSVQDLGAVVQQVTPTVATPPPPPTPTVPATPTTPPATTTTAPAKSTPPHPRRPPRRRPRRRAPRRRPPRRSSRPRPRPRPRRRARRASRPPRRSR